VFLITHKHNFFFERNFLFASRTINSCSTTKIDLIEFPSDILVSFFSVFLFFTDFSLFHFLFQMLNDTETLDESALLIDLENIRLSWEKCYHKLFRYTDLCWLCLLLERRFQVNVKRIVVFMSHPEECKGTIGDDQLEEMRLMYYYLQKDQKRSQEKVQRKKDYKGELATQCCDVQKSQCDDSSVSNKHLSIHGSQEDPLIVNLCSDDDNEGDMSPFDGGSGNFCRNKKSQLTLSDSDTISSHISILEDQGDGLFKDAVPLSNSFSDEKPSTQPLKCLPTAAPFMQRSVSCNDADDDVEWVMSVDSQSVTSLNNEEKENDEGVVSYSDTLCSPSKTSLQKTSPSISGNDK
jgi:hypothetical protein